jgi:hypothetical protein
MTMIDTLYAEHPLLYQILYGFVAVCLGFVGAHYLEIRRKEKREEGDDD